MATNQRRIDWETIRNAYITSDKSLKEIATEFKVCNSCIFDKSKKGDWVKARSEYRVNVSEKNAKKVEKIKTSMETKFWDGVELLTEKVYQKLKNTDFEEIAAYQIKDFTQIYKNLQDIQGFKNSRDRKEQELRIKAIEKQLEDSSNKNNEIVVKIEGGEASMEEYAK